MLLTFGITIYLLKNLSCLFIYAKTKTKKINFIIFFVYCFEESENYFLFLFNKIKDQFVSLKRKIM